jgi:hypothetical protein
MAANPWNVSEGQLVTKSLLPDFVAQAIRFATIPIFFAMQTV